MNSLSMSNKTSLCFSFVVTYIANMNSFKEMSCYMIIHDLFLIYLIRTMRAFPLPSSQICKPKAKEILAVDYIYKV